MAPMARVVFMGTPEFAVPSLQALVRHHSVAGVVTQPDRPSGRGQQLVLPAVKQAALDAGLPVIQPRRLSEPAAMQQLEAWQPELIMVAAFGQILRPAVLALPPHGCVNVHASLLPRHRGAAPIAAAILAGDTETGVTIMQMNAGLDTGPILAARRTAIRPDDTTPALAERLAQLGADLLVEVLPDYLTGRLAAQPQDEALATYAPQLKKVDGRLDFTRPAAQLARQVRAMLPWPGAYALLPASVDEAARPLRVLRAAVEPGLHGAPGEVLSTAHGPAIACGQDGLLLIQVQPPGKRPMPAADFARGARQFIGARLG
jgi:methionyl-tRNA formyltransferase